MSDTFDPTVPLALLLAWLGGGIPFGLLLARRFAGVDVRQVGSGNIGATNTARAAGKAVGVATLLLDAAKAALPALIGGQLRGASDWLPAAMGFAAFVGHCFPPALGFQGGKGVACALGVLLALEPQVALLGLVGFLPALALTRTVGIASLVGTAAAVGAALWLGVSVHLLEALAAMAVVIALKHTGNVRRWLAAR